MRLFGLLLLASACTLDNPAFFVTDGASGDPTRPTATSNTPTAPGTDATSEPPATTSEPATTGTSDGTTDPPATATSTTAAVTTDPPPMTSSSDGSDSSDSSGVDDTGPVACGFIDVIGPQLPLLLAKNNESPSTAECAAWAGKDYSGRLEATPAGFKLVETGDCPSSEVPGEGFVFPLALGLELPTHNFECVKLRFTVHQGPDDCLISGVRAAHAGTPVLTAGFGLSLLDPGMPYKIGFEPLGVCPDCDGCCAPAPDPDAYAAELLGVTLDEGQQHYFQLDGKKHLFRNLRSHIHDAGCQDLPPPEWLHFDWVVLRLD